ncbi:S-methyl-5-thioribose-1-phosphate isomerase [Saitoella coloradoensis]
MGNLTAIDYTRGNLRILDQLALPHVTTYVDVKTVQDGFDAIKSMTVRGAPAIAIVAALALAVDLNTRHTAESFKSEDEARTFIVESLKHLYKSRPTAVNLGDAVNKLTKVVEGAKENVVTAYLEAAEAMLIADVADNRAIGEHGKKWLLAQQEDSATPVSVLTHCNTGSLATASYGTALGIIRSLHADGKLKHAFNTETRPYNQGSRLTQYELITENIPSTLITDSMAAALMRTRGKEENLRAVIVGADRVAANGDTANKIGTYGLAVLARTHGIKFIVAAPATSIDLNCPSGDHIPIEQRPESEMLTVRGPVVEGGEVKAEKVETVSLAAPGARAWNPSFDVTPAEWVDAVVTERGVCEKGPDGKFDLTKFLAEN